jgi:hypothetical protein
MLLKHILFDDPVLPGGKPLFRSQSDLANAIQDQWEHGTANPSTLRVFVSQVMRLKSPPSPKLRVAIQNAVKKRLEPLSPAVAQSNLDQLAEAFAQLAEASKRPSANPEEPLDDVAEFAKMEEDARRASVHFILTIRPAELRDSKKADTLKRELVSRLRGASVNGRGKVRYIFNLPKEETAMLLWLGLLRFLREQNSDENAEDWLKELERDHRLRLNVVDWVYCIPPMVVYNPDEEDGFTGYVLEYHQRNSVSVARLSSGTLEQWKEHVYLPLTNEGRQRPVTLEKFLKSDLNKNVQESKRV